MFADLSVNKNAKIITTAISMPAKSAFHFTFFLVNPRLIMLLSLIITIKTAPIRNSH
jgi:hypothetical protein